MAQNSFSNNGLGEIITIAPRGTGSFVPIAITKTPYNAVQITKLTDKNSVQAIRLHTSNVWVDFQANGIHWPSGSANEYLYWPEPDFTADSAHSGSVSGTLLGAPWTTGSAPGCAVYHVSGLNSRWARITLESTSGGRFALSWYGKGGD